MDGEGSVVHANESSRRFWANRSDFRGILPRSGCSSAILVAIRCGDVAQMVKNK
jgi:hypothetical protein